MNVTISRINNVILSKVGRTGKGKKLIEAAAAAAESEAVAAAGISKFIKISFVTLLQ